MATRFYLPSSGAPPVTPPFSTFTTTDQADRVRAVLVKGSTPLVTKTITVPSSSTTVSHLIRQYVTDPMKAHSFTTTESFSITLRCAESASNVDTTLLVTISIVSGSGAYKGKIYSGRPVTTEFATSLASRARVDRTIGTARVMADGDRLLIEIAGQFATPAAGTASMSFGDAPDTPLNLANGDTAARYPFIEFSPTLEPYVIPGLVVEVPPDETDGPAAVIGEPDADVFSPAIQLSRWGGEGSFRIRHDTSDIAQTDKVLSNVDGVVALDSTRKKFRIYATGPTEQTTAGGMEYEIVFKEAPESNVVSMSIETDGLVFYYQPPLTEQWEAGQDLGGGRTVVSVTETEVIDDLGEVNISRPENVVGSYEVYHATKKGDYSGLGKKNYKTGKAFHIYRPKVIDANLDWAWAELHVDISSNLLTITVPQEFLDYAAYPVVVDPTIGFEAEGGSERTATATYLWTSIREQSDATGGTASKLSAYLRLSSGTTATIKMGYYVDNAGTPEDQALVAADNVGVAFTSGTDAWIDSNAISGTVAASTYYWPTLMVSSTDGTLKYNYTSAEGNVAYYDSTGSQTSLPDTFTHGLGSMTDQMSFYMTYAAAAPSGMTNEVIVIFES